MSSEINNGSGPPMRGPIAPDQSLPDDSTLTGASAAPSDAPAPSDEALAWSPIETLHFLNDLAAGVNAGGGVGRLFGAGILEARKGSGKKKAAAPSSSGAHQLSPQEQWILKYGINDIEDVKLALDFLSAISPRWKKMVDALPENLEVTPSGDGTYAVRGGDRATTFGTEISLANRSSVFALIHEMTHVIPLNELFPDLAALPYQDPEALPQGATFGDYYYHLLNHLYQDEAISGFAELLLYRDMKAKGIDFKEFGSPEELKWLEEINEIYERDGIIGYLKSEKYIGRNHRSSYNINRLVGLALLALINPRILSESQINNVLQEHGVQMKGTQALSGKLDELEKIVKDPSPDNIEGFIQKLKDEGMKIKVDALALIDQVREAAALIQGRRQVASASFVGREREVQVQMGILAQTRRIFENYKRRFEKVWNKSGENRVWRGDIRALINLYRTAYDISRHAEPDYQKEINDLLQHLEQVLRNTIVEKNRELPPGGLQIIMDLLTAYGKKDAGQLKTAITSFFHELAGLLIFDLQLEGPYFGKLFPILLQIFDDAFVMRVYKSVPLNIERTMEMSKRLQSIGIVEGFFRAGRIKNFIDYMLVASVAHHGGVGAICLKDLDSMIRIEDFDIVSLVRETTDIFQLAVSQSGIKSSKLEDSKFVYTVNYRETEYDSRSEEFALSSDIKLLPLILKYQRALYMIRSGKVVRNLGEFEDIEEKAGIAPSELNFIPTLFWLGEEAWTIPEVVNIFPASPLSVVPAAIPVFNVDDLLHLHLLLEQEERREKETELTEGQADDIVEMVDKAFYNSMMGAVETENEKLGKEDLGALWTATRLGIRAARLLIRKGEASKAQEIFERTNSAFASVMNPSAKGTDLMNICRAAIESAQLFVPVWAAKNTSDLKAALNSIIDEYTTTVKLRRVGLKPTDVLMLVLELSQKVEVREETAKLLDLAIEHVATYSSHTHEFRMGVAGITSAIRSAPLTNSAKDELLAKLFQMTIPDRRQIAGASSISTRKKYEVINWLQREFLSSDALEMLALYSKAESVLLGRTNELLQEIGSIYVPKEMQDAILRAAGILNHHLQRTHEDIVNTDNLERLDRVSAEMQYQSDLADVFPSRRIVIDPDLPISQWHPLPVRKGLLDSAIVWEKIKTKLEELMRDPMAATPEFVKILELYQAHALYELQAAIRHGDIDKEISNLLTAYRKRERARSAKNRDKAREYASRLSSAARRVMDRVERAKLDEIMSLAPFAWGIGFAEQAFSENRELSEREIEILSILLSTSNLGDARRMRELYLAVIHDERYPIKLRRLSMRGLAYASQANDIFNYLIDGYQSMGDEIQEARFYRGVVNYWQKIGALPDDMTALLLDEWIKEDEKGFWNRFDAVMSAGTIKKIDVIALELMAMCQGRYAEKFIEDALVYVKGNMGYDQFVLGDFLAKLFPTDPAERKKYIPVVEKAQERISARKERAQLAMMGLPGAFINQAEEIRTLLFLFVKNMPQAHVQSLIREMQHISEDQSDALVFNHFFLHTGLAKAGQFLSTMVGLIPDEDRAVYEKLQDRVPPSSITEVKKTIAEELGRPLDEIFSSFNEEPVASASIGEVYEATLKDGSRVYIKVSPPTKRAQIESSIDTILKVAKAWELRNKNGSESFDIAGLLRAFAKQLQGQLNFKKETNMVISFGRDGYITPTVIEDMVTEHVMVMRPLPGVKVTGLTALSERRKAAGAYATQALKMLMSGEYHADPHPGNVFWDSQSDTLAWLDWGVVNNLRDADRDLAVNLLTSLMTGDKKSRLNALKAAAVGKEYDKKLLSRRITEIDENDSPVNKLTKFLNMAGEAGLYIKPSIMRALAFLITVNGVVHDLDPERDFAQDVVDAYLNETNGETENNPPSGSAPPAPAGGEEPSGAPRGSPGQSASPALTALTSGALFASPQMPVMAPAMAPVMAPVMMPVMMPVVSPFALL